MCYTIYPSDDYSCRTAYYQTGFLHYLLHQYLGKIWGREKLLVPLNHMLKKYYTQSEEQDDLISIGTIGLIKGISTFKPEKGARLATYAARCVENAILSQRNNRRLRWWNGCLLRQNGACWREWESAAIFCFPMYQVQ
ncbi:MAG: sigma factor [Hydrogeniiclostridium mannosilyticum]